MVDHVTAGHVRELLATEMAINLKVNQVLDALHKGGYAFHQSVPPEALLIHPSNRGGLMVNPHDVHAKGFSLLQVGPDLSKIRRSVCFEITNQDQVKKNESLAASSNLLAKPTGKERYLTVSSSHLVSFCRCVLFATKTEHADLAKLCNGHLSLEALLASSGTPCGNPLETMVRKGWNWEIIKADVEKSFPELPHLLAQGLNTDAAVQQGCGEMEAMRSLAELFTVASSNGTPSWASCIAQVKAARPNCHEYLDSIALFARNFGGGPGFPLVKLLEAISKAGGITVSIGQEYFAFLCQLDFKDKATTFPFIRCSCLAVNLTSPRIIDGIGKLAVKTDLAALKAPAVRELLVAAEGVLNTAWDTLEKAGSHQTQKGMVAMGRLMVRTALFLMKKQGKGREKVEFGSLKEISELFAQELDSTPASGSTDIPEPEDAGDAELVDLQACHKPSWIVLQRYKLEPNANYKLKGGDDKIWTFLEITDEHGIFVHKPLFGSKEETLKLDHENLKNMKRHEKPVPALRDQSLVDSLLPHKSTFMKVEEMKAKAFVQLFEYYKNNQLEDGSICIGTKGAGAFAGKTFKKGDLKLVPLGAITVVKEAKKSMLAVLVASSGETFSVAPPKVDWEDKTGTVVPYFAIGKAASGNEGTMEKTTVKITSWLTAPVYRNSVKLEKGTPLTLPAEEEEEAQPKKKVRKKS